MRYFAIGLVATPLALAAVLYALFTFVGQDLPAPTRLRDVEPSVATRLFDLRGRVIDELFVEDRVVLRRDQIPRDFFQAVLSSEDRRFYEHWGLNPLSILRALREDVIERRAAQGASTITQQLARNLFLDHRRTVVRKVREAILALRIERAFGKDEILELYVNQIYFGEGAHGLHAAARRYFGVAALDLSLEQCALLAALPKNPARFSPRRDPEAARARRNLVLRAMRETGAIDAAAYERAIASPIVLAPGGDAHRSAAYFSEMVRQELSLEYGSTTVYHDGLRVETTLDLDLQLAAEQALEKQLRAMEAERGWTYDRLGTARLLASAGLARDTQLAAPLRLQGAVVAIEPATGAIRALVGGRDFSESEFNRAVQAPRQAASAFKPFIYAEAVRRGFRPTDLLLDEPVAFPTPGAPDSVWRPSNFKETFLGPVPVAYALAHSINVPTARLLHEIGVAPVVDLAARMGLRRPLPPVLSLAAGSGEVTLLDLTAAYAVFANNGIRVAPYAIERASDRYGHRLQQRRPQSNQALDARASYITLSMMRAVLQVGTGKTARSRWGFFAPAAGKTGTSNDYADAWFIGFTPDLAVGVWVGFDLKIPIGDRITGTGSAAALPIWVDVLKAAQEKRAARDFAMPDGLVSAWICLESGQLAAPGCAEAVEIAFLPGDAPLHLCERHRGLAAPGDGAEGSASPADPQGEW